MIKNKPIERFEGLYIPEPNSGCWLWIGSWGYNGYGQFHPYGNKEKIVRAHRFSWEFYSGPIPKGLCVLHKCDTPCCVNPKHLFLGTNKDNTQDMISKGRKADVSGEKNGNAKLTATQVKDIRAMLSSGSNRIIVAQKYHINVDHVGRIRNKEKWGHI